MINNTLYPSVSVLGSTGSVGEQAIDVARRNGIRVTFLSANRKNLAIRVAFFGDLWYNRNYYIYLLTRELRVMERLSLCWKS